MFDFNESKHLRGGTEHMAAAQMTWFSAGTGMTIN